MRQARADIGSTLAQPAAASSTAAATLGAGMRVCNTKRRKDAAHERGALEDAFRGKAFTLRCPLVARRAGRDVSAAGRAGGSTIAGRAAMGSHPIWQPTSMVFPTK